LKTKCRRCGKVISRKPSEAKKRNNLFCSKECHGLFMQNGRETACDWCGKAVYKPQSKINAHNFCSAACRNQWLGKYNAEVINVAGHSKGHKARHLTELNTRRNPLCRIAENPKAVKSSAYRSIIEKHIGRRLNGNEIVHHINGNRLDNRIENLKIMSHSEHTRLHMQAAIKKYRELFEGGGG
jgi:endogenous inhibitor of DNA gyrase (YacG/DUF329 family)